MVISHCQPVGAECHQERPSGDVFHKDFSSLCAFSNDSDIVMMRFGFIRRFITSGKFEIVIIMNVWLGAITMKGKEIIKQQYVKY